MVGKVYRIVGTFNPNVGMTLAASLSGGVAYGYKRTSWPEIQKWSRAREFYFLELESQKNFSHLKKMSNLKHFIIEETDIILPEYETGSFENFALEIKNLITNYGMNVYFNSTWKEDELTKSLQNVGVDVHNWSLKNIEEKVEVEEPKIIVEKVEVEEPKIIVKEKHIEEPKKVTKDKIVIKKNEEKKEKSREGKDIAKVLEKNQKPKQIKYQGEYKQPTPEDLELFYSQPKTRWQKMRAYFSRKIEKIVNNF